MKHAYLTQEGIIHALAKHAITESEANKLLKVLIKTMIEAAKR